MNTDEVQALAEAWHAQFARYTTTENVARAVSDLSMLLADRHEDAHASLLQALADAVTKKVSA